MLGTKKFSGLALAAVLSLVTVAATTTADPAYAGKKPSTSKCRSDKSCSPGICVRENPGDRFGVCCRPQTCETTGAECGSIDDGCGGEASCGACEGGSCVDNLCYADSTTTSTTSTTSTTTDTTTTTEPAPTCAVDADCGSGCCDVSDTGSYQCGDACCLGCWWSCFNSCGCPSSPSCQFCMEGGDSGWGCPQASCGCPRYLGSD